MILSLVMWKITKIIKMLDYPHFLYVRIQSFIWFICIISLQYHVISSFYSPVKSRTRMSIHQNSSSLLEVFLSGNRLRSANRRYFQQGKIRMEILPPCRWSLSRRSNGSFSPLLPGSTNSSQRLQPILYETSFSNFQAVRLCPISQHLWSDHSAGFRAERAAHLSHGNSTIGPCKTARGNIRSKMVKHFQGLCCTASSSAMLHACKRISVLKAWKVSSKRPDDIALPRHQNLGLHGNLKQKSSYFILISAKVPWPALCQCRIRPWQQFYPWQLSHLYWNSGPHKRHLSAYDEIPSQIGHELRRLLLECKCRLCMLLQHSFDSVCHLLQRHANQARAMCSSQAGFAFMSKSVCMNVWTIVKPVSFEMIQIDQEPLPSLKEAFAGPFSFALLPFGCMECKRWLSRIISWDSTALHIAEAKFKWKMLKALWYWRLALASPISWRFCLSISVSFSRFQLTPRIAGL